MAEDSGRVAAALLRPIRPSGSVPPQNMRRFQELHCVPVRSPAIGRQRHRLAQRGRQGRYARMVERSFYYDHHTDPEKEARDEIEAAHISHGNQLRAAGQG